MINTKRTGDVRVLPQVREVGAGRGCVRSGGGVWPQQQPQSDNQTSSQTVLHAEGFWHPAHYTDSDPHALDGHRDARIQSVMMYLLIMLNKYIYVQCWPPFQCLTLCHCCTLLRSGLAWSHHRCQTPHSRGCTRRPTSAWPWPPAPWSLASGLHHSPHRSGAVLAAAGQLASVASESFKRIDLFRFSSFISFFFPLTYLTVSRQASACGAPGQQRCICQGWRQLVRGLCKTLRQRCCNTSAALTQSPWGRAWCQGGRHTASGTLCTAAPGPPHMVGTCKI